MKHSADVTGDLESNLNIQKMDKRVFLTDLVMTLF